MGRPSSVEGGVVAPLSGPVPVDFTKRKGSTSPCPGRPASMCTRQTTPGSNNCARPNRTQYPGRCLMIYCSRAYCTHCLRRPSRGHTRHNSPGGDNFVSNIQYILPQAALRQDAALVRARHTVSGIDDARHHVSAHVASGGNHCARTHRKHSPLPRAGLKRDTQLVYARQYLGRPSRVPTGQTFSG